MWRLSFDLRELAGLHGSPQDQGISNAEVERERDAAAAAATGVKFGDFAAGRECCLHAGLDSRVVDSDSQIWEALDARAGPVHERDGYAFPRL